MLERPACPDVQSWACDLVGLATHQPTSHHPYTKPRAGRKAAARLRSASAGGGGATGDDGDGGAKAHAFGHPANLVGRHGAAIEHDRALVSAERVGGRRVERGHAASESGPEQVRAGAQTLRGIAQRATHLFREIGQLATTEDALKQYAVLVTEGIDQHPGLLELGPLVEGLDDAVLGALGDLRGELVEQLPRRHAATTVLLVEVGQRVLREAVANGTEDASPGVRRELDPAGRVEALEGGEQPEPAELVGVLGLRHPEVARSPPGPPDDGPHEVVAAQSGDVPWAEGARGGGGVEGVPRAIPPFRGRARGHGRDSGRLHRSLLAGVSRRASRAALDGSYYRTQRQ